MIIRKATEKDFEALYRIGSETPEFKVSSSGEFMDRDEFLSTIKNPDGVFLLAEDENEVLGFVYANRKSIERGLDTNWACLVYLVVKLEHRRKGVAQDLYDACVKDLKEHEISYVYVWANSESDGGIINFMKKNGFDEGHKYVWMDREI